MLAMLNAGDLFIFFFNCRSDVVCYVNPENIRGFFYNEKFWTVANMQLTTLANSFWGARKTLSIRTICKSESIWAEAILIVIGLIYSTFTAAAVANVHLHQEQNASDLFSEDQLYFVAN